MDALLECPRCYAPFPEETVKRATQLPCPSCACELELYLFPALTHSDQTDFSEKIQANEGEASCFYHPGKRAARICDSCGALICDLCNMPVEKLHLCPTCFEKGLTQKKATPLKKNEAMLYDGVALGLALLPCSLIFWWTLFLSSPAALFISFRYWNAPGSIIRRSKFRFILAILLSLLSLLLFVIIVAALVAHRLVHHSHP